MLRPALCLFIALGLVWGQPLPSPEAFAGFGMGADRKLLRWDKINDYMKLAAKASPRIKYEETGKTTNGHPYAVVTISSPDTMRDLKRFQDNQRRLAYPYTLDGAEAERLISGQKAVVLITLNIHSTEIASSQMVLELVHRLATEESPYLKNILDNVIFVLVPSANPDGQIIVTDWYMKNVGTDWEYSPLPELYHKYTGHDDNRDAFMNTQIESRLLNKLTYKDWFPLVFLDEHQMGNLGARIFVPPFKNPINPNVDPMVWQLNGLLGYAMGANLHAKGYTGIINDAMYTSWWQGGFLMQAWWHNMVGLLTEMASVNIASPIEQEKAAAGRAGPEPSREQAIRRDPRSKLPAPRDIEPRNTYPKPWMGGKWTLRDIVDYELAATWGLLEACANNRHLLVRSFYEMNRRQIEMGQKDAPYAWVVPAEQHDVAASTRLLQILDELGVEVHRAKSAFAIGDRSIPAGSHVVLMAQPFRAFAKDLLEKQVYPVQRIGGPNGPVERPYDVTGWSLPMQMGVDAIEAKAKFSAELEKVSPVSLPAGKVTGPAGVAYEISHASNNSFTAVNRLLKAGANVRWSNKGEIVVTGASADAMQAAAKLGVDVKAVPALPPTFKRLKSPRVGRYNPWTTNMDEGWTRWLLEQYEFPYQTVRNADLQSAKMRERFDVILLADQPKEAMMQGHTGSWVRPEHRGGIGKEGVSALRRFVREGGTLITLGSASLLPIEEFPLPLRNALKGVTADQFSCPGSILRVFIDNTHPVAYGMREEASAVFYNDLAFEAAPGLGDAVVKVIARYPSMGLLQSGWIGGEQYLHDKIAAAEVSLGQGKVILLGFSVQNRAQPHGTFPLLFNAIHQAGLE
jgi:hypothetical protein